MTKTRFNWRKFLSSVLVIAVPVALENLLTNTASMIDTMMIAPLGEATVGAIGLCAQFSILMFSGYWGFVGGGMLFMSQYWGAQDIDGVKRSYGLTVTFLMTVSFIFGLAAVLFPQVIMSLYTDKQEIREIGIQYLRIVGFAYPLQVYAVGMSSVLRATENVKVPFYGSIAGVATNIFFNWVLIYGRLGFPQMGVKGAALATVFAGIMNVSVILIVSASIKFECLFDIKKHFKWTKEKVSQYIKKCFPIICNEVAMGISGFVIAIVMGHQVTEAIAAIAVLRTIEGLVIAFFAGFSNASSILVGAEVGAGKLEDAYSRAKHMIPLIMSVISFVALVLNLTKPVIIRAMGLSGESFRICSKFILIYSIIAIIRMSNWLMNDTYRASGDATTGTVLEIAFMYVLVLPLVCLTGLKLHLNVIIVFACCYCDELIRIVLMLTHLRSGRWIRPVTPQGQAKLVSFREGKPRSFYRC